MDSIKWMNEAVAYIEAHLEETIDTEKAAHIALCSEYHFKRMFTFLAGVSLSEYIRRRRLSLAALDLQTSDPRIIDVAVKYGYTSSDSFSRAFQAMHGILPSEVKQGGHPIKTFPKISFILSVRGGQEMNVRLIEKEAFKIAGFMKRVPIVFNGVNPEIAKMYEQFTPEHIQFLKSISNVEPKGILSASVNFSETRMEEQGELDHYIGVATSVEIEEHYAVLEVQSGTWAVFEVVGPFPETLQAAWGKIYAEWFPSSGYESVNGPEILWNESKDTSNPEYRSEIWIPVKKARRDQ